MAGVGVLGLLIASIFICFLTTNNVKGEEQSSTIYPGQSKNVVRYVNHGDGLAVWWTTTDSHYIPVHLIDSLGTEYHTSPWATATGAFIFIAPKNDQYTVQFINGYLLESVTLTWSVDVIQLDSWNNLQDNINAQQNVTDSYIMTIDNIQNSTLLSLIKIDNNQNDTLELLNASIINLTAANTEQNDNLTLLDTRNKEQDIILEWLKTQISWLSTINDDQNETILDLTQINDEQNASLVLLNSKNNDEDNQLGWINKIDEKQNASLNDIRQTDTNQNTTLTQQGKSIDTLTIKNSEQDERLDTLENKNSNQDAKLATFNLPIAGVGIVAIIGFIISIVLFIQNKKLSNRIMMLETHNQSSLPPTYSTPPIPPAQPFCGKCGATITSGNKFCPTCGTKIQ